MTNELMRITGVFVIVCAIVVLAGLLYWASGGKEEDVVSAGVVSIGVDKPNFVITARGVDSVSIFSIPTGTDIDESSHQKIADAVRENDAPTDGLTTWTAPIPTESFLATEIYAVGYGSDGVEINRKSWVVTGASDIYNTLWLEVMVNEVPLSVGESSTVDGLTLTLTEVINDSRCPIEVTCISAGSVEVQVSAVVGGMQEQLILETNAEGVAYSGYYIEILSVEPEKTQSLIVQEKYIITFGVSRDIKL